MAGAQWLNRPRGYLFTSGAYASTQGGPYRRERETMSQAVNEIIERWSSDEAFRTEMRADPVAAAERHGFQLSDEERQALASVDLNQSDEELSQRISQAG